MELLKNMNYMSTAKEFLLKVGYKGTYMREGIYEL